MNRAVSKGKQTFAYEKIYVIVVGGVTNNIKIIKRDGVTSGSKILVNSGWIIVVHCGTSFCDSQVSPACLVLP